MRGREEGGTEDRGEGRGRCEGERKVGRKEENVRERRRWEEWREIKDYI